jgi:signal transduction histidine kinase
MLGTMTLLDEKRVLDATTLDLGLLSMMATATGLMVAGSRRTASLRAALTTVSRRCDDAEQALKDGNLEIATVAHELRNAVAGTVTAAALIHRHALELGDPELADMADAAKDAGEDAHRIVSDLLGRSAAHGAADHSVALTDLVAAAAGVAKLAGIDPPHGLAPMLTTADGVRLRQVIRNLVDNAVRYGGPHVWLDLAGGDGLGHVSVLDDGPGVAPELVERMFQAPVSSNQIVEGRNSHGYGLVTAGAIAHDLGGDLTYHREVGRTRFTLTVPLV